MDLKCGFFNSVNGDRTYTADDMSYPYSRIISNGIVADNTNSSGFQVISNSGLQITVKAGFGLFGGKWAELEKDTTLSLSQAHVTLNRIDSIIVRCNKTNSRKVELLKLTGTPAENPVVPAITRNDNVIDYRLANILVKASSENINQSDVTDTRASSECGFVTNLLQNSNISSTYDGWRTQFTDWLKAQDEECEQFISEKEKSIENTQSDIEQTKEDFETWTNEKEAGYNQWFSSLTQDLTVGNVGFLTYDSVHTAENNDETEIPIGINEFSSNNDVLSVFINGLKLIPEVDYTLNDFESITLTKPIDSGTVVSFFLLKTVLTSEYETTLSEMQKLQQRCNELEESISTNSVSYTFVVDSNEALAEWANNDRSKGQDYTSVLIKKGEWTCATGVNLTTAGTKVVNGEAGSLLIFGPMEACLYYDIVPDNDCYMKGLTVKNGRGAYSFVKCINLENCIALESNTYDLKNITNCTANDFRQGENYFNCTANCFWGCRNLSKCTAEHLSTGKGGYGFRSCYNLIDCNGAGTGTIEGYGFESCTGVFRCKGRGSTGVFKDCYASQSKTADYACADTPAGGFNDTTNPSA